MNQLSEYCRFLVREHLHPNYHLTKLLFQTEILQKKHQERKKTDNTMANKKKVGKKPKHITEN